MCKTLRFAFTLLFTMLSMLSVACTQVNSGTEATVNHLTTALPSSVPTPIATLTASVEPTSTAVATATATPVSYTHLDVYKRQV